MSSNRISTADRPILFSAPMVRSLLSGAKTQTRRIRKERLHPLPYAVGARLWIRETWSAEASYDTKPPSEIPFYDCGIYYVADGRSTHPKASIGKKRPAIFMPRWASRLTLTVTEVRVQRLQDITEADAIAEGIANDGRDGTPFLVQMKENVECRGRTARECYHALWATLHSNESWRENPHVVAITFTVAKQNIDRGSS